MFRSFIAVVGLLAACSSPAEKKPATPTPPAPPGTATVVKTAPSPPIPAAPPEPTCKTVTESVAPGYCGVLAKAPRMEGAGVDTVTAAWNRIEPLVHTLSGRETTLAVLSPQAKMVDPDDNLEKAIKPAAYICPGTPPTVFVPATLVELIDSTGKDAHRYPVDFLAFVLGHELGHRMNDLTSDGCQLAAFQRPGKGVNEEELADARSAFFITTSGFSASRIAREDMVSKFLEAEYKLTSDDTKTRRQSLLGALTRFDDYEALYQAGLSVAMSGDLDAADRLLTWADELVQASGVLLPEIRVLRATTRIERAAKSAPWGAELDLPVALDQLHCTPLHPGHSGLWQEPAQRVRGDLGRGKKLLREALQLLDEAEARGATPFTVAAARACANVYLGDADAAAKQQARAEALLPAHAPAAVKSVLADNRTLVTFVSWVRQNKVPQIDDLNAMSAWADRLGQAMGANASPGMRSVVEALHHPGVKVKPASRPAPVCANAGAKKAAAFEALPASPGPGTCATGYTVMHVLPPDDKTATQGLTVCRHDQDATELVSVKLPPVKADKLEAFERTLRTRVPPAELADLSAWACNCESVDRTGVSDHGEVVYTARCPAIKLDLAVLVTTQNHVDQLIQLSN